MPRKRRVFSTEYKAEVVKLIQESGKSVGQWQPTESDANVNALPRLFWQTRHDPFYAAWILTHSDVIFYQ